MARTGQKNGGLPPNLEEQQAKAAGDGEASGAATPPGPALAPIDEQLGLPEPIKGGLTVSGRVVARSRRDYRQDDGAVRTCVTYRVLAGIDVIFVDDWSGQEAIRVGSDVVLPVYVRAFVGRAGSAQFRLVVAEENGSF